MNDIKKTFWAWAGKQFSKIFDPQFILGALILIAWLYFLEKPLGLLSEISFKDLENAKAQASLLLTLTAGISGLFTTALGFVLGHFFGKQGIELAEQRTTQALKEKEEAEEIKNETIEEIGQDSLKRIDNIEEGLITLLETIESIEAKHEE